MDQMSVQERLKTHSKFWLEELAPSSFKEIVTKGYCIPFIHLPDPVCYRNHRSVLKHADFVRRLFKSWLLYPV